MVTTVGINLQWPPRIERDGHSDKSKSPCISPGWLCFLFLHRFKQVSPFQLLLFYARALEKINGHNWQRRIFFSVSMHFLSLCIGFLSMSLISLSKNVFFSNQFPIMRIYFQCPKCQNPAFQDSSMMMIIASLMLSMSFKVTAGVSAAVNFSTAHIASHCVIIVSRSGTKCQKVTF